MPPRARPGDRLRIEAALDVEDLRWLVDVSRLLGVRREAWQRIPILQQTLETVAVLRTAEALRLGEGETFEASIERAAFRLGLPPDTIRTRWRRWLAAADSTAA